MTLTCPRCGGTIRPKLKKLAVVGGGMAAVAAAGAVLATPTGWMALIPAVMAGSANASKIVQLKYHLWKESEKAGSFFICHHCEKDVDVKHVFLN